MDALYGPGNWRPTGDFRTQARENQLRAQGAATVAPGVISRHSRGTADAPGAHDFVTTMPMSQAVQLLPPGTHAFVEGGSGSQGPHIHMNEGELPSADDILGPPSADDILGPPPGAAPTARPAPAAARPPQNPAYARLAGGSDAQIRPTPRNQPWNEFTGATTRRATEAAEGFFRNWWQPGALENAELGILMSPIGGLGDTIGRHVDETFGKPGSAGGEERKYGDLAQAITPIPGLGMAGEARAGARGLRTMEQEAAAVERARPKPPSPSTLPGLGNVPLRAEVAAAADGARPGLRAGVSRAPLADGAQAPLAAGRSLPAGSVAATPHDPATAFAVEARRAASGQRSLPSVDQVLGPAPGQTLNADREANSAPEIFAPQKTYQPGELAGTGPQPSTQQQPTLNQRVRAVIAPATVDPDAHAAAMVIRGSGASHQLLADRTANDLLRFDKQVGGEMPMARFLPFVDYLENRSAGAKLGDPTLQPVADQIRKSMQDYRDQAERVLKPEQVPDWIEDYYAHLWQERPSIVTAKMQTYMQGSGRSFKARTLPTIADGIQAGLTPKTTNPLQNTITYAQNMSRFLTTNDVLNTLKDGGLAGEFAPGKQPEGWVPLDGILTRRPMKVIIDNEAGPVAAQPEKLTYAPPGAARVYNNWISPGFTGDLAPFVGGARQASNAVTQLKLGLSGFHAVTMAKEAMVSEGARVIQALARGDLPQAAKSAGTWATGVGPAASQFMRGGRLQRELLSDTAKDPISQQINDLYVQQGGRLKMDPLYRSTAGRSFYDSLKAGTLARDVRQQASTIFQGTPWERTKNVAGLASNAIQSVSAPLFEEVIPRLKQGAFAQAMEDYLRANPAATPQEKLEYAKQVGDSMDNRFGELVQDNLFWQKQGKQMAQIALLSPTWNIGTLREIGGGLADVFPTAKGLLAGKGLNVSTRTAYVASLAATAALANSVYQYLKTGAAKGDITKGELPQDVHDLIAPRTGGVQNVGNVQVPERAAIPGYEKDVYGFGYDFPNHVLQEGINKLNPALSVVTQSVLNRDYRDAPIRRPGGVDQLPGQVADEARYLGGEALPISAGAFQKNTGSNIGLPERLLGIKPSPGYVAAPDVTHRQQARRDLMDWQRKQRYDRKDDARKVPSW